MDPVFGEGGLALVDPAAERRNAALFFAVQRFGVARVDEALQSLVDFYFHEGLLKVNMSGLAAPVRDLFCKAAVITAVEHVIVPTAETRGRIQFKYKISGEMVRNLVENLYGEFFFKTDVGRSSRILWEDPAGSVSLSSVASLVPAVAGLPSEKEKYPCLPNPFLFPMMVPPEHRQFMAGLLCFCYKEGAFDEFLPPDRDPAKHMDVESLVGAVRTRVTLDHLIRYGRLNNVTRLMPYASLLEGTA